MSKLPPEIEKLLWEVAESHDPKAFEEFGERFPHLRGELGKRIQMLRDLKGNRPSLNRPVPPGKMFSAPPSAHQSSRWLVAAFAAVAMAALAFGSYRIGIELTHPKSVEMPKGIVAVSDHVSNLPPAHVVPDPTPPGISTLPVPHEDITPGVGTADTNAIYSHPQTVKMDRVKLSLALQAIALSGHCKVEIAPGLPDPLIRFEYRNMTVADIFNDLGRRLGFTALVQGPGSYLILPVRDPNKSQPGSSMGDGMAEIIQPAPTGTTDPYTDAKGGDDPNSVSGTPKNPQ